MNTYTVIAYVLPAGGHHASTITAADATGAAVLLRERLGLNLREFEVVAIAVGEIQFAPVDERRVVLAPFSTATP